ncbi:MAG: hypothetical protein R2762_21775 [Bryobacteraceae bacterium]
MSKYLILVPALLIVAAAAPAAENWSAPAEVTHDDSVCVTYRARVAGDWLVVEARHEKPWHTYAIDNEIRAKEKLAGKMSLGIDQPTSFKVSAGLEVTGGWMQSPPHDLSKPDLRWYTWGFEDVSLFAAKVKRTAAGPATVAIRGQACSANTCKNINVTLSVPVAPGPAVDLQGLVAAKPE